MIRDTVNAVGEWFDEGLMEGDTFTTIGRFVALIALIGVIVLGVVFGSVWVVTRFTGTEPPSLFCANGTELHSAPATEIIAKVPVDGVKYTCG